MALTAFQRRICRLLAGSRLASGESYVAGGIALGEALAASRVSRDLDLFHDSNAALDASWRQDRALLAEHGFEVRIVAELSGLAFEGPAPDPADLSRRWHRVVTESRDVIRALPPDQAGNAVLTAEGDLFRGSLDQLIDALAAGRVRFHAGRIHGAYPRVLGE